MWIFNVLGRLSAGARARYVWPSIVSRFVEESSMIPTRAEFGIHNSI